MPDTTRSSESAFGLVHVAKHKRPYGIVSQWDAYVLREDTHGLWLHSPKDSVHHIRNGERWIAPWNGVQLLPRDAPWWVAWFWDRPGSRWIVGDICTPAVKRDDGWSYIDLELDPIGHERGFDHLADEDEFCEAVEAGHITPTEERRARDAARDIAEAMTRRQEPFGITGWLALDWAAELALPATP